MKQLGPAAGSTILFALLCIVFFWIRHAPEHEIHSFLMIWAVTNLNLILLAKAVVSLKRYIVDQKRSISAFFWVGTKLLCLIFLMNLIWRYRSIPGMTLILALTPMVWVPIIGGYAWSTRS